ncbi:uncharacterized protein LOC135500594 [Lineus longissimus]|uniref:uncharacterized protein LOC135500594 n=1 Tax=Lineus longissimus TaxID=88925 RepID=UPI002B4F4A4D
MKDSGKCMVLVVVIIAIGSLHTGRAAKPSPARVAAFFMQQFLLGPSGKELLRSIHVKRTTRMIADLKKPKNLQKLVMFMNGEGGQLWQKLAKNAQIAAVFKQFQEKKISSDKLFDFLKKLSLYLKEVKMIMTALIQGMDDAMQKSGFRYASNSNMGTCTTSAQSLLQQIQNTTHKLSGFEKGEKLRRALAATEVLLEVDEKLQVWGKLVKVALQPIAALFPGDLWSKALQETELSFRDYDKIGGEATRLFQSQQQVLHARVNEWQNIKFALISEQKKIEKRKQACLTTRDFNKLALKFQKRNTGFMKHANKVNQDLFKLKKAVNGVKEWRSTKLLSFIKRFVSNKDAYEKVAKQYKGIKKM